MAIYRLEKKSISRGNGHNLCAAIGYRAGLKITDHNPKNDERKTHDYSKKSDVAHSEIILTDELKNAGVQLDFEQIANLVEQGETTKRGKMKMNAKLASEYVLAGSHELSLDENIQAFREFAEQQSKEQGVIAMLFVHDPKLGNDIRASKDAGDSTRHHDPRNIHAHIVVLSRQVDLTASGQLELGDKSDSELSDTDRAKKGLPPSRVWLKAVREQWANIQNKSLESHNIAPVTHKSYRDLGIGIKPGIHLGKDAKALEKKGIKTYIGAHNDAIKQYNESATNRIITREVRASEIDDRTTHSADIDIRKIGEWLSKANSIISKRPTAEPVPVPVTTESSTARAREQLIARRFRAERQTNRELERANQTLEHNLFIVASRLAWRKEHSKKYDERQIQELDAFCKKFNIRDFRLNNNEPYVSPALWGEHVLEHLTVDDMLENPQIFKIVADPEQERLNYHSKSLKFDDSRTLVTRVVQAPNLDSKTSQNEDLTPSRPSNPFRPR